MLNDSEKWPRILVVDDDPNALQLVRHALEKECFEVVTAHSGEEALRLIERFGLPHLAIVDYSMPPGMNGFEFGRTLREYCDLPLIMLSAVDETEKIIRGLEEFADDYIIKPFNPKELVARVQRALRRVSSFDYTISNEADVDGNLVVDFPHREATVNGEDVSLTPTENKILYILMKNAGRTVTTDFLLRRLWPNEDAQEDRLHVHIHRLRRKVEPDAGEPHYIVSDRGQGYRFPVKVRSMM